MTESDKLVVGWDTETHLIASENLAPPIVCLTISIGDEPEDQGIFVRGDGMPQLEKEVKGLLLPLDVIGACHNLSYDLCVLCAAFPDLISDVYAAVVGGRMRCTLLREKLLSLTGSGEIDFFERDGKPIKADYSLSGIVRRRFGVDLSQDKAGLDAWRLNYALLTDTPLTQWPAEARRYAIDDAYWARMVFEQQEQDAERMVADTGIDPFATQTFQFAVDFSLRMMSCIGMAIDNDRKKLLVDRLTIELAPEKHLLLVESGILRPATPPRAHLKNSQKWTKGEPESINTKMLKAFVEQLAKDFPEDVTIKRTDASPKFPDGQISTDAEWLGEHMHLSPMLEEYAHRQSLQKLVNTELPRMSHRDADGKPIRDAAIVHPLFDVLKTTGRTSSYASDGFPSFNCQNVHSGIKNKDGTKMDVRGCFIPRPGNLMASIDYSYMELCTLAQKCIDLFGASKLADIINAGLDPHAWLGSQLCFQLDADFKAMVNDGIRDGDIAASSGVADDPVFVMFSKMEHCGEDTWEGMFKHYRKMAKPTGLGYPGGLGPKTFIKYAKATFGVHVDLETATALRDAWRTALPEMPRYFEWINNACPDPRHKGRLVEFKDAKTGEKKTREVPLFAYFSPMGLYRPACDYCAAANGAGLQTPSAEGAKLAVLTVARSCFDPAMDSILYGTVIPLAFVHDEIIFEVVDDGRSGEYLSAAAELMVESFKQITPAINVKAVPVLMRRWDKDAKPVFDAQGKLIVWEPRAAK